MSFNPSKNPGRCKTDIWEYDYGFWYIYCRYNNSKSFALRPAKKFAPHLQGCQPRGFYYRASSYRSAVDFSFVLNAGGTLNHNFKYSEDYIRGGL